MKYTPDMPKPPRGFTVEDGTIRLLQNDETGFDPNAAYINLVQYYADLADTAARIADPSEPLGRVTAATNLPSGSR